MNIRSIYDAAGGDYNTAFRRIPSDELIGSFLLRFPSDPTYGELMEARERESAEEIYRSAHALKGLASVLGLKKLALAADELAERARRSGAPPDGKYFEAVTDEYTRVVGLIARMLCPGHAESCPG